MFFHKTGIIDEGKKVTTTVLNVVDGVITKTVSSADSYIEPVRKSVLQRFPTLFLLLVTFGISATSFAFEKILSQYDILNRYPWLIFILGVGALALTGTLYKKLH